MENKIKKSLSQIRSEALENLIDIKNVCYSYRKVQAIQILVRMCDESADETILIEAVKSGLRNAKVHPSFTEIDLKQADALDDLFYRITGTSFEEIIGEVERA